MVITEQADAAYRADPSRYQEDIAKVAGTDLDTTRWLLAAFPLPTPQEQKTPA